MRSRWTVTHFRFSVDGRRASEGINIANAGQKRMADHITHSEVSMAVTMGFVKRGQHGKITGGTRLREDQKVSLMSMY